MQFFGEALTPPGKNTQKYQLKYTSGEGRVIKQRSFKIRLSFLQIAFWAKNYILFNGDLDGVFF
jgi:hypothetical protein